MEDSEENVHVDIGPETVKQQISKIETFSFSYQLDILSLDV